VKPEMIEALCIRVPKTAGEFTRKSLIELRLLDDNLKIKSSGDYIFIPVSKPIEGLGDLGTEIFEISDHENPMPQVPGAYELIGDIAIIDQHEKNALEMANILLKHKNIKTIFQAISAVSGEYRSYSLKVRKKPRPYTGKTDADTFLMLRKYILHHGCQLKG
jgi:tRNA G37 N-methylase Trm5